MPEDVKADYLEAQVVLEFFAQGERGTPETWPFRSSAASWGSTAGTWITTSLPSSRLAWHPMSPRP